MYLNVAADGCREAAAIRPPVWPSPISVRIHTDAEIATEMVFVAVTPLFQRACTRFFANAVLGCQPNNVSKLFAAVTQNSVQARFQSFR
jgi:hypothetical protein